MGKSKIAWTDVSWNPVTGCNHVSAGCENCYAEALSLRRGWSKKPWTHRNAIENIVLHYDRLEQPLHWREPRKVFVNSMSDLFHGHLTDDFIDRVLGVMAAARQHTFQVLTKRPSRMLEYIRGLAGDYDRLEEAARGCGYTLRYEGIPLVRWPIPNIWLGVSVENQPCADERIPVLLETSAAVRWISAEPLLGPVILERLGQHWLGPASQRMGMNDGLDWVVVGGESGSGHRPMKIEWLASIVDQCCAANVPVFVKQDSGPLPGKQGRIPDHLWALKQFPKTPGVVA